METDEKVERRLAAVLELVSGRPWAEVESKYQIPRSRLSQLRHRALTALRAALDDGRRGPRRAVNRTPADVERDVLALARRHPTWPAKAIAAELGGRVRLRTVARLRKRAGQGKIPRRPPPRGRRRSIPPEADALLAKIHLARPSLGAERLSWDLANEYGVQASPSWVGRWLARRHPVPAEPKPSWEFYERRHAHSLWHGDFMEKVFLAGGARGVQFTLLDDHSRDYVFSDLFPERSARVAARGLIQAMRAYRVIPAAIMFDNGAEFRSELVGNLLEALGVRRIYIRPRHPQTNGKLERAFWDDWREFYWTRVGRPLEDLRREHAEYVRYRNEIRGHRALGGAPATSRLAHRKSSALPWVLARLESYARHPLGAAIVRSDGTARIGSARVALGRGLAGQKVELVETVAGFEVSLEGQTWTVGEDPVAPAGDRFFRTTMTDEVRRLMATQPRPISLKRLVALTQPWSLEKRQARLFRESLAAERNVLSPERPEKRPERLKSSRIAVAP